MPLYNKIEASIFIPYNDKVFYFGGREEGVGDVSHIYKFSLSHGDLSEVVRLDGSKKENKLTNKICLHKLAKVGDYFVVFGFMLS